MKITTKFWIGLGGLVVLSPFGLWIPKHFKAGSAWGEWGMEEVQKLIGYNPIGLEKFSGLWNAPIPDYAFKGWEEKPLGFLSFSYILSAVIGVAACIGIALLLGKFLSKK
jgi:hypothetical protein